MPWEATCLSAKITSAALSCHVSPCTSSPASSSVPMVVPLACLLTLRHTGTAAAAARWARAAQLPRYHTSSAQRLQVTMRADQRKAHTAEAGEHTGGWCMPCTLPVTANMYEYHHNFYNAYTKHDARSEMAPPSPTSITLPPTGCCVSHWAWKESSGHAGNGT